VVALGYKADVVKSYFLQFADMASDLTINLGSGTVERRRRHQERWIVHLIDTGLDTLTGGRVLRLAPIIGGETFMLTYGDGLSDVPLDHLLAHHRSEGKLVTVTAVPAPARFGGIEFDDDRIVGFAEKHARSEGWINGGYMVMEPGLLEYLVGDKDSLEASVLERLAQDDQLVAYKHTGFWQCMDTMREKQALERLWASGAAPWTRW
jgi:glucose-1-phosphate cytidylyltransferase